MRPSLPPLPGLEPWAGAAHSYPSEENPMTAYKARLIRKRAKLKQAKIKAKARARKKAAGKKR